MIEETIDLVELNALLDEAKRLPPSPDRRLASPVVATWDMWLQGKPAADIRRALQQYLPAEDSSPDITR